MNFKNANVQRLYDAAKGYVDELKSFNDKSANIRANYAGDLLKSNMAEHMNNRPDRVPVFAAMERHRDALYGEIDKMTDNALSALSPDYTALTLPVKLTEDEVQRLFARNSSDPLFIRALQEYCTKNEYDYVALGVCDPLIVRRKQVDNFYSILSGIVRQDDMDGLTDLEIMELDKRLNEYF